MLVVFFYYKEHTFQRFERMGRKGFSCALQPKQEQHSQGPIKCVTQIASFYELFPQNTYCKENINTYTASLCLL